MKFLIVFFSVEYLCKILITGEPKCDLPPGLVPIHKQSVMLFLERVYGVEDQETFFKLLEDAFLPDLRTATMIERVIILEQ